MSAAEAASWPSQQALLGANKIIGCDIDEVAVKVAGENAALNGVQDRIAFIRAT